MGSSKPHPNPQIHAPGPEVFVLIWVYETRESDPSLTFFDPVEEGK